MRVTFVDEDGESVRYDRKADQELIYEERFKRFLRDPFSLPGREFKFLGFSHSSLRSQTCWFMAPFFHDGTLLLTKMVIARLGDFTKFRSPARCAARIGQAFTDTTGMIALLLQPSYPFYCRPTN